MVPSVQPCTTTVWKPGTVHLAVSRTVSSRSVGSSPVFVGNFSPGSKLTHLIMNPCAASWDARHACHSCGALCKSDSFIMAMTLLMVGVPSTIGTRIPKEVVGSSTTKATWSSLYPSTPSTCTQMRTYPSVRARPPTPTKGTRLPKGFRLWSRADTEPTFSLCFLT